MKKPKMTLIILFLILKVITTSEDICTSNYQSQLKSECQSLTDSVTGEQCHLFNNRCQRWYKECSEYDPESEFDDDLCKEISPSDPYKKCSTSTENGDKKCVEIDRECQDTTDVELCINYNIGSEQRCVYLLNERKCEKHFNNCDGLEQSQCANNIPKNHVEICKFDRINSKCISEDRICSEFLYFRDSFGFSRSCTDLKRSSPKVCISNDGICSEVYKTCSDAKDKNTCEKTNKLIFQYTYYKIDEKYSCVWDENTETCQEKEIYCEDYKTYGKNPSSEFCRSLKSKNSSPSEDYEIWCNYDSSSGECKVGYGDCDTYNIGVTNPDERDEKVCNSIFSRVNYKCILKDKTCQEVHQKCQDLDDSAHYCHILQHEDPEMKCAFGDGKCRDMFLNCEAYNNKVEIADRIKEDCESIIPSYDDGKLYACIFSASNICEKKEVENCEDFGGKNETYCQSLSNYIKDSYYYYCTLKNNSCIKQFNSCNRANNKNKTVCETIELRNNNYYKCVFSDDYYCLQKFKTCSDYSGDSDGCLRLNTLTTSNGERPLDFSKKCVYENGKCYETTRTSSDYPYCSNYKGTDKNFCESIQPRDTYYNSHIDYTSKCVYRDYGCERVSKTCSDAKNYKECSSFKPSNENKKCVFLNNVCVEQYKTCQLYEESGETLDKNICESIIMDDFNTKCVFTPVTGSKGNYRPGTKSCEDFNIETLKSQCDAIDINSYDYSKKCAYSNNACSLYEKSCFELQNNNKYNAMNEEMCEAASTGSSETKCHYTSYYGCYIGIIDNNVIDNSNENGNDNEGNQQGNDS